MSVAGRSALVLGVVVSIAAPVFACWASGVDFLLLLGRNVLRPGQVSLIIWSFGVLVSTGVLAITVGHHRGHLLERRGRHVLIGGALAVSLVGTGTWCVGHAVVVDGLAALGTDAYTVLRAPDTGGCALIAHEHGALRTSSGQAYAVSALGYARPVGFWHADEIELPVRDGTYSLHWDDGLGSLSLGGHHAVTPDRLQLACPQ